MKTLEWFGFLAPSRGATHGRGKLRRLVDLLTRGATPVDGLHCPEKKPNPEPVRWGNFR
jgi:hypothetical protein